MARNSVRRSQKRKRGNSTEEETSPYFNRKQEAKKRNTRKQSIQHDEEDEKAVTKACFSDDKQFVDESKESKRNINVCSQNTEGEIDILRHIWQSKRTLKTLGNGHKDFQVVKPAAFHSSNIVHSMYQMSLGLKWTQKQRQVIVGFLSIC